MNPGIGVCRAARNYRDGDPGARHLVIGGLLVAAIDLRQRERWPARVNGAKYIERLARLALIEVHCPALKRTNRRRARFMRLSLEAFERHLAGPLSSLSAEFLSWTRYQPAGPKSPLARLSA